MIRAGLAALALAAPSLAAAHSFWLEPESQAVPEGEAVEVAFKVGDAGDVSDWGLYWERVAAFQLYSADAVHDQQTALRMSEEGQTGAALIAVQAAGTHVLAFASNPSFSDLPADRFNEYLEHEGLRAILAHREARGVTSEPGTELYARRAKALLKVGEDGPDGAVTRPIGHTLEIVPQANPLDLAAGEALGLLLLWRGQPLAGASLAVARLDASGEAQTYVTDAQGKASVSLEPGQRYLVSSVWGVPAPNDARADYFTVFASLTF